MPEDGIVIDRSRNTIRISRTYAANVDRAWWAWTDAEAISEVVGPAGLGRDRVRDGRATGRSLAVPDRTGGRIGRTGPRRRHLHAWSSRTPNWPTRTPSPTRRGNPTAPAPSRPRSPSPRPAPVAPSRSRRASPTARRCGERSSCRWPRATPRRSTGSTTARRTPPRETTIMSDHSPPPTAPRSPTRRPAPARRSS